MEASYTLRGSPLVLCRDYNVDNSGQGPEDAALLSTFLQEQISWLPIHITDSAMLPDVQ